MKGELVEEASIALERVLKDRDVVAQDIMNAQEYAVTERVKLDARKSSYKKSFVRKLILLGAVFIGVILVKTFD